MKGKKSDNILLVYLEPTPYIIGLVKCLQEGWAGSVDVLFVNENLSQNWGIRHDDIDAELLPSSFIHSLLILWKKLSKNQYDLLHLAGWGKPVLLAALIIARLKGISVVIETDTPLTKSKSSWKSFAIRSPSCLLSENC